MLKQRLLNSGYIRRLRAASGVTLIAGAMLGSILAIAISPYFRTCFRAPTEGIGAISVAHYPKGYDYFAVMLTLLLSVAGALGSAALLKREIPEPSCSDADRRELRRGRVLIGSILVAGVMAVVHDHPFSFMDMFHEGEHLSPASVLRTGGRPYRDIFFLHGFATDGGLDALALGSRPSPLKTRRVETVLDAVTVALMVPIAAEVAITGWGVFAAVVGGLCAIGAGLVPSFPYFRLAPLLLATLCLLHFVRRRSRPALFLAAVASTLGVLWSLDVGVYAVTATTGCLIVFWLIRVCSAKEIVLIGVGALLAPIVVLLCCRADLGMFVSDSFVTIPRAIDATWSLPAKEPPTATLIVHPIELWRWIGSEPARYYLPPVLFGLLFALCFRECARGNLRRASQVFVIAAMSTAVFRTAAGRCSWSHTRFGVPLLGIAIVAFVIEPLLLSIRSKPVLMSIVVFLMLPPLDAYLEVRANVASSMLFVTGWRARQAHVGLVHYPLVTGRGLWTYPENAADLSALDQFSQANSSPGSTVFDVSGERALYYFLNRRPATRCPDIAMLSTRGLTKEALAELQRQPPAFVVLEGQKELGTMDGVANSARIPRIMAWINAHYPVRRRLGRFLVATQR